MQSPRDILLLSLRTRAIPIYMLSPSPGDDLDLRAARKNIFAAILNRLAQFHINRPLPEKFFIGQCYVNDKHKINCIIRANFVFPAYISPFDFWLYEAHVAGLQYRNVLQIQIHRQISRRLWDDIRLMIPANADQFIIGYLASYMPTVNRYLLDNRYNKGHLLSRTFAIFEAAAVSVTVNGRLMQLRWPPGFAPFLPSANFAPKETPNNAGIAGVMAAKHNLCRRRA